MAVKISKSRNYNIFMTTYKLIYFGNIKIYTCRLNRDFDPHNKIIDIE